MALFGQKSSNIDAVPQEVQEYYQSERRERTGVAWLLALATLAVTLILAVGLFWGGRWVYRSLTNKNDKPATTTTTTTSPSTSSQENNSGQVGSEGASTTNPNVSLNNNPSTTSTPSTSTPAPKPTNSTTTTTAPTTTSTPATSQSLANTGPTSTILTFVIATVTGTLLYRFALLRRTAR